jgi:DNA-directed RNA polymerase specialized sigma24 family protein
MPHDLSDEQLVRLIERIASRQRAGDAEAALRQLYDLTSAKLYGVAVRVLGNREWAEDVLQDAFLTSGASPATTACRSARRWPGWA